MYKPLDKNVINNFEYLKDYLTRPQQVTPNHEVPVMNACTGLIDAIIQGKLFVCSEEPETLEPPQEAAPEETE